jgi:hypothetical protein
MKCELNVCLAKLYLLKATGCSRVKYGAADLWGKRFLRSRASYLTD